MISDNIGNEWIVNNARHDRAEIINNKEVNKRVRRFSKMCSLVNKLMKTIGIIETEFCCNSHLSRVSSCWNRLAQLLLYITTLSVKCPIKTFFFQIKIVEISVRRSVVASYEYRMFFITSIHRVLPLSIEFLDRLLKCQGLLGYR
jgi:hypothetical protein